MGVDDTRIGDDEYRIGFNVRNRFGELRTIEYPTVDTNISGLPAASKDFQGVYTIGDFIIVFIGGYAYFKHRLSDAWVELWGSGSYAMSETVSTIYAQAVPASTMNFTRQAVQADDASAASSAKSGQLVINSGVLNSISPAAIIVQDGINQPNVIVLTVSTGSGAAAYWTVRKALTYLQWTTTDREYVPVGRQMAWLNGKLYLVSQNGRAIYHSVTGRPLDFMIGVKTNGDKLNAVSEDFGGAPVTSYAVSYDAITHISPLNTESLVVSTSGATYSVTPDRTFEIFGEPTFTRSYLFSASIVNQFSFVDILGDFAFIDKEGLRSFNAVAQLRNEGRNSAFSLSVASLFKDIVQNGIYNAAIEFDNYAYFSVSTVFGHFVLVYDIITKKFVSLDTAVARNESTGALIFFGPIKQFTKISTATAHELYGITEGPHIIKFHKSAVKAPGFVQTRAWASEDPRVEQKPIELRLVFNDLDEASSVLVNQVVNGEVVSARSIQTKTVNPPEATAVLYNAAFPIIWSSKNRIPNLLFNFQTDQQGWKVSYLISWTGGSSLFMIHTDTQDLTPRNPLLTQAYG